MDWSQSQIPPMRLEARFGDRVVPAFSDRPASLWAMIADACARNPQGEALIAGHARLSWRQASAIIAQRLAGRSENAGTTRSPKRASRRIGGI